MDHGPGFGVKEIVAVLVLEEGGRGSGHHLGDGDERPTLEVTEPDRRRPDVDVVALEAGVGVELGEALVEPGGHPMHIGVQDAVGVLVEDDGLVEFTGAIESHQGELAFPAAKELTCDFVALFPEDWRESLQAWLVDGNDEQGRAGVEDRVLEESGEDGTHLLEFFGDIAAIFFRAVGNDAEVRALNLAPGLRRWLRRDAAMRG